MNVKTPITGSIPKRLRALKRARAIVVASGIAVVIAVTIGVYVARAVATVSWVAADTSTGPIVAPSINIAGGPLTFAGTPVGGTSAEMTYTVSGSNLNSDIVVTVPSADFQVSTTTGTGFGPSVTFTPISGSVSPAQTVFVRFTPQSAGTKSGDVTNTSNGATTENVAVSGTVPATLGSYPDTTINLSGDAPVTPSAAPTSATRINVSTSTKFKGQLEGDPATGVVRVTDAHPAAPGFYTVTVTAFNSEGATTSTTFKLTVTTPPTCNPVDFASTANFNTGTQPVSVAIGDFNRDGKQDLAVANSNANASGPGDVVILPGNGAGSFGAPISFGIGAGTTPLSVVVGDFNGDGKQDLAVANANSANVSVLLGTGAAVIGAGSFGAATNFGVGLAPISIAVGDFNGDGKQDLATANRDSNSVSILLGNGAGGFGAATDFPVDVKPQSVAVGDFDNDGIQDLVAGDTGSGKVSVLTGNGSGGFGAPNNLDVGVSPYSVAVGDFNGDGWQDIVSGNYDSANVSILMNNGSGGFGASAPFPVGTKPLSVAAGDFDGDGKQDLAVANQGSNNVSILAGNGAGSFGIGTTFGVGNLPRSLAVGDFNGDGKQDLAVASQDSDLVSILMRDCPPEIDVQGNSTPISDGASTPNATDGTDFGSAATSSTLDHDFTITNSGGRDLHISGIALGGANANQFSIQTPTTFPLTVAPTTSATLTIRFAPTNTGPQAASVNIASDDSDEDPYDFAIAGTGITCSPIAVSPVSLPNGVQDVAYNQTIGATGGTGPYTFAVTNGSLPNGLSLSTDGILDGAPGTQGTFNFTVTATDSSNVCTGSQAYTIVVNPCPTSLDVTSTADTPDASPGDGVCADNNGKCTLRAAIQEANALGDTCASPLPINFCIPAREPGHVYYKDDGTGTQNGHLTSDAAHIGHTSAVDDSTIVDIDPDYPHSWWSILPATPLPAIEVPVTINGYSQPGSRENCKHLDRGDDAILRIELNGFCLSNGPGLDLEFGAGGSTITGLAINHFAEVGILLGDEGYDSITGNFIGTDVSGTLAQGSTGTGISIVSGDTDCIGGDTPAERNLISGHVSGAGVDICGAADSSIEGNYIGTDRNGLAALGDKNGVTIRAQASGNIVGCEVLDGDNLISGNSNDGVLIKNACLNNVQGNFIGTDRTGCIALANGGNGVEVRDASDNYIGVGGYGNLISGNGGDGVLIKNMKPSLYPQTNLVQGNFIGTNLAGKAAIPNTAAGVELDGSSGNLVGGFCPGEGNVISGNGGDGVEITDGASGNAVEGNFIGLKADCNGLLGNVGSGVEIYDGVTKQGSSNNLIGLDQSVVGPSQLPRLDAGTPGITKPAQTSASRPLTPAGPAPSLIVGNASGANVIAGNGVDGVRISNPGDINNVITENSIYSNAGRGINLVGGAGETDGVTPNDLGTPPDTDTGPNNFQNFPDLISASSDTGLVTGELYSTPRSCFRIEFFGNATCDGDTSGVSSGTNGEGQTFLGSKDVYTDSNGHVSFTSGSLALTGVQVVTATATARDVDDDNDGGEVTPPVTHTSEFSACRVVTGPATADLGITKTASPEPTAVVGNNLTYAIAVHNYGPDAATNVAVSDTLPANVGFVSATPSQGSCSGTSTVICNLGTINNGAAATVQIVVTVSGPAGTDVSNTASVSSSVSEPGSDPHSNSATAITQTSSCPNIFTVTSNGDAVDASQGDGHCDTDSGTPGDQCTLRAAIEEANALPACGTIDINFSGVTSPINLATALPSINHNVNINGPGANLLTVQRNSASSFRVFTIAPAKTVSISGLTISNGSASIGGGIYNNRGTLTVTNCTISGNQASSAGGGIHNGGLGTGNAALTITNSTISSNSSAIDGGGVYSDAGSGTASLAMINSTVSGNTASNHVGGVYVISSPATLTNVTVTNNRADSDGSGAGAAGGLSESSGTVTLHNTIVAGNFHGTGTARDDINGTLQAASSYNLIGDGTGMFGISNGDVNHNQVGSSGSPIDPLITALANNGGPTLTHATLYNSPAIDKGDNLVTGSPLNLATDQRGALYNRQENGDLTPGAVVDIGAYERQTTEKRKVPNGLTVPVDLVDARLTFPCVPAGNCVSGVAKRDAGQTGDDISPEVTANNASITVIDPSLQPTPPAGYAVGTNSSPVLPAFDVTGPGSFDTPVQICFYLPTITNAGFFGGLKILHNEGGVLVDVTNGHSFSSKLVCGSVTSLSPFVIAQSVTPTAVNGDVRGQILDSNGNPVAGAAVRMSGTQNRLTVTDAAGNYHFDNVETNGFYTVVPARANYSFSPSQRSFSALGQHTDATFNATSAGDALNPLYTSEYFVRQQYLDFLGREPDEAGLNFWVNNIDSCGADANCRVVKRIDTSAAFFLSIEFQQTGYLVYRTYQAAYGDLPGAPVPIRLGEFKPDTAEIGTGVVVNQGDWQTTLEQNKVSFMAEFVQRPRFISVYSNTLTPSEFVDNLFMNAGVTPTGSERAAVINEFGLAVTSSDAAARGRALRRVAENTVLAQQEFNQAFVLMQYFGYLRRDANSRPDADFSGFSFWLEKLNTFNGNFGNAEMVKAFLLSGEYRGRFPR